MHAIDGDIVKKHIAFSSPAAHGHVNPTLPLVEELTRRGHRVTYATSEEFTDQVVGAGAELKPIPNVMPSNPPAMNDISADLMAEMMEHMLAGVKHNLPVELEHFEQDRPDAFCYDMMDWAGRLAAGKLGIPAIQLHPSFASHEHLSMHDRFAPDFNVDHPRLSAVHEQFQEFTAEHGLSSSAGGMFNPVVEPLNLVFLPREFQLEGDTFDKRFAFLGPSLGSRENSNSWTPPESGSPVLFISLGTTFNDRPEFFRICLDAFADSDWHVAMAVGHRISRSTLGEIPANFDVRESFPQPAVLRHARTFVSHAGMNSTMESLYNEVPLVTVPQQPEQDANAQRAEELGAARRLTGEITAESLRTAVDEVSTDTEVRANLASLGHVVRKSGGAAAGVDAIESHLTSYRV